MSKDISSAFVIREAGFEYHFMIQTVKKNYFTRRLAHDWRIPRRSAVRYGNFTQRVHSASVETGTSHCRHNTLI